MKVWILGVVFVCVANAQAATSVVTESSSEIAWDHTRGNVKNIDCEVSPGTEMCLSMKRLGAELQSCTGEYCYELWRAQLRHMRNLTETYYETVGFSPTATTQVGELALSTAKKLCGYSWTGEATAVSRLVHAANNTLSVLKEIQIAAGIEFPKSCKFTVNP